ncbi:8838_t:CDS:2 [Scutellospora calospora]|uniref:8838_t:CDS:1 n=1 Tax=Scutellospora calospora TaxID=85575 RepID=A0ACA9KAN1_9GLOM|nr:8838_t:CDS:2 [Scutellospora calospora]
MNALSTPITYEGKMQDNISTKMFMSICYNLRPSDLLAMACVCKDFKNILDENINPLAGEIWCISRNRFTIFKDKDPPLGINQQTFARLLTFKNGCQFCKTDERTPTVYWVPGVRSCRDYTFKLDNEILGLIVPVIPELNLPVTKNKLSYYWVSHVKNTIAFLMDADANTRLKLNNLRINIENIYKEAQHYHEWTNNLYQSQVRDQGLLFERLLADFDKETSLMLQNDKEYKKLVSMIRSNPFLLEDWQKYKIRIFQIVQRISCEEYVQEESSATAKRKSVDTNIQQGTVKRPKSNGQWSQDPMSPNSILRRRTRVMKRLRKLTYGTVQKSPEESLISIRDPLYAYLSMCPSFLNPPIIDELEYSNEFLEGILIPTLKREAEQLCADRIPPPPYLLDTEGALELGLGHVPVFGCLICTGIVPGTFKRLKKHVKAFHKIDDNAERVISVNCDAMITYMHHAFIKKDSSRKKRKDNN